MEPEVPEFKLSCQIHGHQEDVRGIGICGDLKFATGSRDKTVRLWSGQGAEGNTYTLERTMTGHTSFVGPVSWIPPNDELPKGGLASGGMDTTVLIWNVEDGSVVHTLRGHELQVTSVAMDWHGDILSGSVDKTVRRWRGGVAVEILSGHQGPVQAVIVLPSGDVVTGSSDCTLKIWQGSKCIRTFTGHTDTVRGLAYMQNVGILSASHDGSVRLWSESGDTLLEMIGHTAIVYSVAAHVSGDVASGSEDCFVKIWRGGVCCQSIQHPGCVWDVKFLPNGDLVTACSDGVARVWTKNPKWFALPEEVDAYETQVAAWRTHIKTVGGMKVNDLPGMEALREPGTKNGQTRIIREGDNGVAYSWNAKEFQWDKIGEVIDRPGDHEGRLLHNGVHYDHVFDVDIGDGEPIRKLPYNRGDNPYSVADQWLLSENLPLTYRQQVVEFILQNSGQSAPPIDASFSDPYTGGNAYVPQQQPHSRSGLGTSSGAYAKGSELHKFKHIPKKGMVFFDAAQYDGILRKLESFNSSLAAEEGNRELALTEKEMSTIHAIMSILKDTSHYHSSKISEMDMVPLSKLLLLWPAPVLYPALDILRMVLLHPEGAKFFSHPADSGKDILLESLQRSAASPTSDPNQLMGIRAAVNCFRHMVLKNWMQSNRSEILDMFSHCHASSNKNIRIAYSTLLLNYSTLLVETKDEAGQIQVLSAAMEVAGPQEQDPVSRYRSLVALGSLVLEGLVKSIAIDLDIKSLAHEASTSTDSLVSEVAKDIEQALKA